MSYINELLKKQASKPIKNIRVKVESIETGEVEKDFCCGTNQSKADRLENGLLQRTNLDKYHVYQSITK